MGATENGQRRNVVLATGRCLAFVHATNAFTTLQLTSAVGLTDGGAHATSELFGHIAAVETIFQ